jgi:hypothetical protein
MTDAGNPYVYAALGGKNFSGSAKPGKPNLNVLGQAPGQTFPTIRGIGDSNAMPPVYSSAGNPATVASKGEPDATEVVTKANPHRHETSGQFISKPTAGSPSHDQRTRTMFATLSTRKSLNTTQESLAPAKKAETLVVAKVARQSQIDNPAVYKGGPGSGPHRAGGGDKAFTHDNIEHHLESDRDGKHMIVAHYSDGHRVVGAVHANGHVNLSPSVEGTGLDVSAKARLAQKSDDDKDGDNDSGPEGKAATLEADEASRKALGTGTVEDHKAAYAANIKAAKVNPLQSKYHENRAQVHLDACGGSSVPNVLKVDPVAAALQSIANLAV